jgi:hypothetical protein
VTGRFDLKQYRLLLRLLSELGSRRELTSQFGLDQHAMMLSGAFGLLIGGVIGLAALGDPPARGYLMATLGITTVWLLPRLVSQAADAFMNPAEVAVLAHRPVRSGPYLAAKATYVVRAALVTALPFNLIPAFAGATLDGTRWFYPMTHLAAAALAAVFTTFIVCGAFGVLFRVLPLARVRSAALWAQLLIVSGLPFAPQLLGAADIPLDLDARAWSLIPVTWFAALGLVGQAARPPIDPWLALPAMLVSGAVAVLGLRALTQDYMTRVSTMMRIKSRGTARLSRARARRRVLFLPGGQAVRAGAAFVGTLAWRDWQFRRTFLGGSIGLVILFAVGIGRRFTQSPLGPVADTGPLPFLPLMLGILMVNASMALAFTDRPGAKWIFDVTPARGLRGLVHGAYWGLWRPLVALPHLVLLPVAAFFWGPRDALFFVAYSLSITSLYLGAGLWLADGLPFTKPPDPGRARALTGVIFAYLAVAVGLGVLQRFVLFRHVWLVPVAAVLFGLLAWLAAAASFRILESRILQSLARGSGARRLFTDFDG